MISLLLNAVCLLICVVFLTIKYYKTVSVLGILFCYLCPDISTWCIKEGRYSGLLYDTLSKTVLYQSNAILWSFFVYLALGCHYRDRHL